MRIIIFVNQRAWEYEEIVTECFFFQFHFEWEKVMCQELDVNWLQEVYVSRMERLNEFKEMAVEVIKRLLVTEIQL